MPFWRLLYRALVAGQGRGGRANVPAHGRALLVANHAGIVPWDATMIGMALLREHPLPRHARFLVLNWAFDLPWLSVAIRKVGGVAASPYNALRLLEHDQLVAVFPEGVKGTGKPFCERYRLQRFGRGGFVELALRSGAPIVPVAVVGSEEIHPKIAEAPQMLRGCSACRSSRSPRPFPGSARSAWCHCRRSGGSSSATRSRPPATAPRPRGPRARLRALRARARHDPAGLYENLVRRGGSLWGETLRRFQPPPARRALRRAG